MNQIMVGYQVRGSQDTCWIMGSTINYSLSPLMFLSLSSSLKSITVFKKQNKTELTSGTYYTTLNSDFPNHSKAFEFPPLLPITSCAIPLNSFKTATSYFEEIWRVPPS